MVLKDDRGWGVDDDRPHLGGYVIGGDLATFYPDLWDWLVNTMEIGSVIDVGCGEGHALRYFRDKGCRVLGIDGIEQDDPDIVTHDYATGPYETLVVHEGRAPSMFYDGPTQDDEFFDLAWSCEFVEHVEEQFVPNFLRTFRCARFVLMTHAEPGQAGWHHVNCQTADYWKGAMAAVGYELDWSLTEKTRLIAGANTNPWNHFRRSGLAFKRR